MANLIGDAGRAVFGDVGKDLADYLGRRRACWDWS